MAHDPWSVLDLGHAVGMGHPLETVPAPKAEVADPHATVTVTAGAWLTLCNAIAELQKQNTQHAEALGKMTAILAAITKTPTS